MSDEHIYDLSFLHEYEREVFLDRKQVSLFELSRLNKNLVVGASLGRSRYTRSSGSASSLIELILLNIPSPPIVLTEMDDWSWGLVDGRKRLRTIIDFCEDRFELSNLGILHELNGRRFRDLDSRDRRKIEDYLIQVYIIRKDTHPDVRFYLMKRLLSSGTQSDQYLRNLIYPGAATRVLEQFRNQEDFKNLTATWFIRSPLDQQESVLRFIAFVLMGVELPYKNYRLYLNHSMRALDSDVVDMEQLEEVFAETMKKMREVVEGCALGIAQRMSVPLFEAVSASFTSYDRTILKEQRFRIQKLIHELVKTDHRFHRSLTGDSMTPDGVAYRFECWQARLRALF